MPVSHALNLFLHHVARVAQHLANLLWAFATLELHPGRRMMDAVIEVMPAQFAPSPDLPPVQMLASWRQVGIPTTLVASSHRLQACSARAVPQIFRATSLTLCAGIGGTRCRLQPARGVQRLLVRMLHC